MAIDFPASPSVGQLFSPSNGGTYQWNGTFWLPIGNTTATIYVGDTPPSSPIANQFWFNSALGQTFLWYNDGDTTQWVPANPSASLPIPGVSTLYSETVLGSPAASIAVTFPANCRKVEVEFSAIITGGTNVLISGQLMQSGTPLASGYNGVQFYGASTGSAGSALISAATGMGLVTGLTCSGSAAVFNNVTGTDTIVTIYGRGSASQLAETTGTSNAALFNTITGFRLSIPSDTFRAGSWMRSYVVT